MLWVTYTRQNLELRSIDWCNRFTYGGISPIHLRTIEVEFLPWTDRVEALSFHYGTKILSRNAYDENSVFRDSWNG